MLNLIERHENNRLLFYIFCISLPILALLKGILTMIPCLLINSLPTTLVSIFYWPKTIFYTYYTCVKTAKFGLNMKVLTCFLLPFPLLLWPIGVLLVSIVYGAWIGLSKPIKSTFDRRYTKFYGGMDKALEKSFENVKEFYNFNTNSYFKLLSEYRNYYDGDPWDFSLAKLSIGLLVSLCGALIDGFLYALITIIQMIPALFAAYYHLWKLFCQVFVYRCLDSCKNYTCTVFMFPIFLLGNVVIPFAMALIAIMCCFAGIILGFSAGFTAYKYGIKEGFAKICEFVDNYGDITTKSIYQNN